MNILYIVSRPIEINTSSSIRNRSTILGLLALGHHLDLVSTEPDKNHTAYDPSMSIDGITKSYVRLGGIQSAARIGRALGFLQPFKKMIYRQMSKNEIYDNLKGFIAHTDCLPLPFESYDIVISSSDPKSSHLFVDRLKNKHMGKHPYWIQIWGDPFAADVTRKNNALTVQITREEQRLLKSADKIVYVSEMTLKSQQKSYPDCAKRMVYSPIPYENKRNYPREKLTEKDIVTLLYCGDYNSGIRNILPLYNAVKHRKKYDLTVCGQGEASITSTDNVHVSSRVSHQEVEELEAHSDILVHLSNLKGSQIPGKIYQMSATNKPVLFILDGDSEGLLNIFKVHNRYEFVENNENSILNGLQAIITASENNELTAVEAFAMKTVAEKLIKKL